MSEQQMPKVSILVPVCNVEKFVAECLDSIVCQTLREIEIICINDGSTDSSLSILQEFAAKDSRIIIIDQPNGGYGKAMNAGLRRATGEYIGIVESDDFVNKPMFETLYEIAKSNDAEAVKSNYFRYTSFPFPADAFFDALGSCEYDEVFCPSDDPEIFYASPAIWSGLYRRDFLAKNDIDFVETPGASFQDTAFNFKVWACAKRAVAVHDAFLHYRVDNESSSVKSKTKVYFVNEEFAEIESFLDSRPELKSKLTSTKNALKFGTYNWNLDRLSSNLRYEYFQSVVKEFQVAKSRNELDEKAFTEGNWKKLQSMLSNPDAYYVKQYGPIKTKVTCYLAVDRNGTDLRNTVDSILAQSEGDFELICMQNDFHGDTLGTLKKYVKNDSRITIVPSVDFLNGKLKTDTANGPIVCFARTGELLPKDAFATSVQMVGADTEGLCYFHECEDAHENARIPSIPQDIASAYYAGDTSFPITFGQRDALADMPISPYAIEVLAALCSMSTVAIKESKEALVAGSKKPERKVHHPAMERYRSYVDDFYYVQEYCAERIGTGDFSHRFYGFSYHAVRWLRAYHKVLPETTRARLDDKYNPQIFMEKILKVRRAEHAPENPKISVIVPVYNKEEYVAECIKSILRQTLHDIEVICVNDGSTDDSLEAIKHAMETDSRIVLVDQVNCGVGQARNHALETARGEFVCFMDADDFYPKENVLERLYGKAIENNVSICGGTLAIYYTDDDEYSVDYGGSQRNYVFSQEGRVAYVNQQYDYGFVRYIFKRQLLIDNHIEFPNLTWFEDPVFLVETMVAAGEFYAIPDYVYAYRQTHKASEIVWTEEKACDCLMGLIRNLHISHKNHLAKLHVETLIRIESDYMRAFKQNLDSPRLLRLLMQANEEVDHELLCEADVNLPSNHIIRPLFAYTEVVAEGYKNNVELKKLRKQNKKLRKMTVVQRGVAAIPRYSKKFYMRCKQDGVVSAGKRSVRTVKRKLL